MVGGVVVVERENEGAREGAGVLRVVAWRFWRSCSRFAFAEKGFLPIFGQRCFFWREE